MSSLAVILASRSAQQGSAKEQKILDTSGPTSNDISEQLDLFAASSRTSKGTSALDFDKSSKIWKDLVTQRRGEYSVRLKSAHHINGSESSFLPTPTATTYGSNQGGAAGRTGKVRHSLESMAKRNLWPTPTTQDNNQVGGKDKRGTTLGGAVRIWPTPTSRDYKGGYRAESLARKSGRSRAMDLLPNAVLDGKGTETATGQLNPTWVEWLMGLPTGWTDLGSWETE